MWHELFSLGPTVGEKILRAVLIYLFLLLVLRVAGKRELGQLNTMDFIVLLAIANAVQNGIIGNDNSVTGAVIGATTLVVVNLAAVVVAIRSPRVRHFLIGVPTVLVEDGVVNHRHLRRERMSDEDLDQAILEAGASDVSQVRRAVIEPNGRVAVTLAEDPGGARRLAAIEGELVQIRALLAAIAQK